MKTYIDYLFIFLIPIYGVCVAQPDPITIQFVEAQPLWEHLTWDTTFYPIGNQPAINKYNVVKPHQCYRFNNDLMISNYCTNHRGELYGYILEQLDIESGEVKWQNFSTYYNDGMQDYYKNLNLRDDGNLEMVGIKRYGEYPDTLLFYWNNGGGSSNYIRKVFNYGNGDLVRIVEGHDVIQNIAPSYQEFYPIKQDSAYLVLQQTGKEMDGTIKYGYDFYILNGDHNLMDSMPVASILYETDDPVSIWSYGQPPYIKKLNDTTFVCLIFQDRNYPEKTKAQLIWIDIHDLSNIAVIKRLNIESLLPGNETSYLYFNFEVIHNRIYITQPYYNDQMEAHTAYYVVLDEGGNLLHNLNSCMEEFHVYEALRLVYSAESYDYVAAFPSKTGRDGLDILQIRDGSDSLYYLSSLTSAVAGEEFTRQMEISKLYDDGLFVIGAYTRKIDESSNSAVKYYAFDGYALGMELETGLESRGKQIDLVIYPNPTRELTVVKFKQDFSGNMDIYDSFGRLVKHFQVHSSDACQVDLSHEPAGVYYMYFYDIKDKATHFEPILLIK